MTPVARRIADYNPISIRKKKQKIWICESLYSILKNFNEVWSRFNSCVDDLTDLRVQFRYLLHYLKNYSWSRINLTWKKYQAVCRFSLIESLFTPRVPVKNITLTFICFLITSWKRTNFEVEHNGKKVHKVIKEKLKNCWPVNGVIGMLKQVRWFFISQMILTHKQRCRRSKTIFDYLKL